MALLLAACADKRKTTQPTQGPITESVYASGMVESKDQYEVFATVSGIVQEVYVKEGDTVQAGTPLLMIQNEAQRLNRENARASALFADMTANQDRLREAELQITTAKARMDNDSVQLSRQRRLWDQQIGARLNLEQAELAYANTQAAYRQAVIRHADLKRQLQLNADQTRNNLRISDRVEGDYMPRSTMNGMVYRVLRQPGELVGPQTALAVIGDAHRFILRLRVDEQDIFRIQVGQKVLVTMDSHREQAFEARVTRVLPIMDQRSKTVEVEAAFVRPPQRLLPNITCEANIVINEKASALLLPRRFLLNDSTVVRATGDTVHFVPGLRDYEQMEIRSGLSATDVVVLPVP